MTLTRLTEGVWCIEGKQRMGAMNFPVRMTIVRLATGGLWLHSPIALDEAGWQAVEALGEVEHIVAPNLYHHMNLPAAVARLPEARLWGAPGLEDKRPDLAFDGVLGAAPAPFGEELDQQLIEGGPGLNEVVFFHRPSRTLIVTDLVFNIQRVEGVAMAVVLWAMKTNKRYGQSRMWRFVTKDRDAAARSVGRVLTWPFDRVVMAHGEIVEADAHPRTEAALGWMAEGA